MSPPTRAGAACACCLRRSWLLAQLAGPLDCNCRADGRLIELLGLRDKQLIAALGGRRRAELRAAYAGFSPSELAGRAAVVEICRHDRRYPPALHDPIAPATLFVTGDAQRLVRLTKGPVVALVGTTRATDYGIELAGGIARGLAASGLTVVAELADGIARAALEGAVQARGTAIAVLSAGADMPPPARRRELLRRVEHEGAAVSELPCGTAARRWSRAACARIVAALAELTIVVEADDTPRELAPARIASSLGRQVAAVPGRVTSRASRGTNALLGDGARLVRDASDVLDLLGGVGAQAGKGRVAPPWAGDGLESRLGEVLERVGAGEDTPQKLTRAGEDAGELLQALSELELLGRLTRGAGGRYVPRIASDAALARYSSARQMEP
ncbi:MAG TPA: DNA-processing protein DprA [Solirubrobacteraceae bacterium]|nr:DNA-processing protein DprA [Solirubrobacteraceae bacterium]